jgi:hypothetical protein
VLEVIRKLGYRKTAAMTVDLPEAEDWTESADAPAFNGGTSQDRDPNSDDELSDEAQAHAMPDDESLLDSIAPRQND